MADATVRIWWFSQNAAAMSAGFGHGSIEVPATPFVPPTPVSAAVPPSPKVYITWGPDDGGTVFGRPPIQNLGVGINTWGLADDTRLYGQQFDTIPLPLRGGDNPCGLDRTAMVAWWTQVTGGAVDRPYRFLSTVYNCDGTVVEAMKQGGAGNYITAPGVWFVRGAASLKKWVSELRVRLDLMNATVRRAGDLLQNFPPETWNHAAPLWQSGQWLTESAVTIGRRTEQIAMIDTLLPQYEATVDAAEQTTLLYAVLAQVLDHMEKKPTSDRRLAVSRLGRQVCDRLSALVAGGAGRARGMAV